MSFFIEGLFPVRSLSAGGITGYQSVIVLLPNGMEVLHGFLIPESMEESIYLTESESEIESGMFLELSWD
ncbi:unnamed protein product [Arabidopsis lyrata]|nr:unnamed protein product [Arabidopsis lyrata]